MRTRTIWTTILVAACLALPTTSLRGDQEAEAPRFVGANQCGKCHGSKATGEQLQAWRASPHGKAYETLGGEKAKQVAAKFGIEEPQNALQCLRCHTTAAGVANARLGDHFQRTDGVQCESCHGAGERYAKIEHMIDNAKARELGLIEPGLEVCKQCHNDSSPTFVGFDYRTAVQRIRHRLAAY